MSSLFSKIVSGEIPCHKVAESDKYLAFLDIKPLAKGHTLVIPKKEVDYIFDLDDITYQGLMLFGKKIAISLKEVFTCKRVGAMVVGTEVPHAHLHLIPFQQESQVATTATPLKISQEEMGSLARKIQSNISLKKG